VAKIILKGVNTMAERQLTLEEKWALMPLRDLVMKALQWGWLDIFLFSRVLIEKSRTFNLWDQT